VTDRPWHDSIVRPGREPSRGTGSTVEQRTGYVVRTRGDTDGFIEHEYECPVHGRFRESVERSSVPDEAKCSSPIMGPLYFGQLYCGQYSPWVPPLVGIGRAAGEVES
jgi:hypothetical protein